MADPREDELREIELEELAEQIDLLTGQLKEMSPHTDESYRDVWDERADLIRRRNELLKNI